MDVTIGQLLDKKYRIVRLLGEGGMGAVYEGENIRVHNRVAIKVLHAGIANNQAVVERFEREAQAAGRIGSEHIVEVYDLGDLPSGARYMVMEYLDGESLSARVTSAGRMTPMAVATVMMELLDGLGAAHKASIIHRDLKPDNIFLMKAKGGGDFVKIVDFGVSKFNALSGDSAMSMTRTGAVIGTPYYMSPEQARGAKDSDHRSDLYSAGVVMFECVTGQVPFLADTFNELMFKIVLEPPPDPEKLVPGLDPSFCEIIRKGMAREPVNRYQSAEEFRQAIGAWMAAAGAGTLTSVMSTARGPMESVPQIATGPASSPNLPVSAQTANPNQQLGGTAPALASSTTNEHTAPGPKANKMVPLAVAVAAVALLIGGGVTWMARSGPKNGPSGASSSVAADTAKPVDTAPITTTVTATPTPTPTPTPAPAVAATADAGSTVAAATPEPTPTPTRTTSRSHADRGTKPAPTEAKPTSTSTQIKGRTITETL